MKPQSVTFQSLYNIYTVEGEFNKENLLQHLKKDSTDPLEGIVTQCNKYEKIMCHSDVAEYVFFIVSGYMVASEGKRNITEFYGSQDIIGWENWILEQQSSYSFEVISDSATMIQYKKIAMIEKLLRMQEGYLYYYVHMQDRLAQMKSRQQLLHFPAEERVRMALFQLSKRHGKSIPSSDMYLFPRALNKGLLAQYTHLNPNTITVVFQKLHREKIISAHDKVWHIDISKLKATLKHLL